MWVSCRQPKLQEERTSSSFFQPVRFGESAVLGEVRVIKWVKFLLPNSTDHTIAARARVSLCKDILSSLISLNSSCLGDIS